MAVTKGKKQEVLKELVENMKNAKSVIFADNHGLSVKDLHSLRGKMREKGVSYKVAKKTLIRLAAKENGYDGIPADVLAGQVGVAFSMEDELSAAKLIHEVAKKNKNLKLLGALFEGKVLSIEETKQLATLPSKEELIAKFIFVIKSPISGFHSVLNNTLAGFVRALDGIAKKQTA